MPAGDLPLIADREPRRLALLVSDTPYRQRSPRSELDVALAAAAMDLHVDVYFLGDSVLQLSKQQQPSAAGLPAGYRAWAALPDLGSSRFFAEKSRIQNLQQLGIDWLQHPEALDAEALCRHWREADLVWKV